MTESRQQVQESERQYRVVVLDEDDRVVSSYGDFQSDDEFVRRVLGYARRDHGDSAVLQRRTWPVIPPWETIA